MIDGNHIRAEFARYLHEHTHTRWGLDAALMHVGRICYDQGVKDAATDFAGTVAGGASWWDDVWADHAAALDRARERISQAALRGEVKT